MLSRKFQVLNLYWIRKFHSNKRVTLVMIAITLAMCLIVCDRIINVDKTIVMPTLNELAGEPQIVWTNTSATKTIDVLGKVNAEYRREFEAVLNRSCHAKNLTGAECLSTLDRLDVKYRRVKLALRDYHPSWECAGHTKRLFHSFWKIPWSRRAAKFSMRIVKLNIMSFLATQNLHCSKLVLWKLDTFPVEYETEIRHTFEDYFRMNAIAIETFDVQAACKVGRLSAEPSFFSKSGICLKNLNPWLAYLSSVSISDLGMLII